MTGTSFLQGNNPLANDALALFLVQLCLILTVSRLLAIPLRYMRQPTVIAEVIGGILLGQSALGKIPGFTSTIFPPSSLPSLKLVADIGLMLFLFLVGMELDLTTLTKGLSKSVSISLAGIVIPFAAGVGVSKYIYDSMYVPAFAPGSPKMAPFYSFMVFCGVAMSITAFPVLARILTERKLLKTDVGQVVLAAAATDDAIAWCLLVLVVALIHNPDNAVFAVYVFLAVVAWFLFLWFAVRPALSYLVEKSSSKDHISQSAVLATFVGLVVSGWYTEAVGLDAIFGGFLMGMITPTHNGFRVKLTEKVEDLVSIFFLPLYFAYAGLNVNIGGLNGFAWGMVALSILVACGGKIIGCTSAALLTGLPAREALTVGFLMNTKGLVELIVLTLGLNAGVITTEIYTVFVLMALVTTFMTVPIVSVLYPMSLYNNTHNRSDVQSGHSHIVKRIGVDSMLSKPEGVKVLVVLPNMRTVPAMMSMTQILSLHMQNTTVYALRLIELSGRMSKVMMAAQSSETLRSDAVINVFRTFSQLSHVCVRTLLAVCGQEDYTDNILDALETSESDLVIYPVEVPSKQSDDKSVAQHAWRDSVSDDLFNSASSSVAVFYDRGFGTTAAETNNTPKNPAVTRLQQQDMVVKPSDVHSKILFAYFGGDDDSEAAILVQHLARQRGVVVHVLDFSNAEISETVGRPSNTETMNGENSSDTTTTDVSSTWLKKLLVSIPADSLTIEQCGGSTAAVDKMRASAAPYGQNDIIVVGREHYARGGVTGSNASLGAGSVRNWLDCESNGSFMVVQKGKVKLDEA